MNRADERRARSESPPRDEVRKAVALAKRAMREKPEKYLWRFGYGRYDGEPNPQLELSVSGHEEEYGHTQYMITCNLCRKDDALNATSWSTKKRLCDLREELHDIVKEGLGDAYAIHFGDSHFAHHGGLPGTTARLRVWMNALASCINGGALTPALSAAVLRFLDAPVPKESEAALLKVAGRCRLCTLPLDAPSNALQELCSRCQAQKVGITPIAAPMLVRSC
jgi:hypothetical protein